MPIIKKLVCNHCGAVHTDIFTSSPKGSVVCVDCNKWINEELIHCEKCKKPVWHKKKGNVYTCLLCDLATEVDE